MKHLLNRATSRQQGSAPVMLKILVTIAGGTLGWVFSQL
jgi:hypothetical protein